jgi:hypothetical protein
VQARRTNIVFVGGPTPERVTHLEAVADLGLSVYGYGEDEWKASPSLAPCCNPPIDERDALNACYNGARISVNVTRPHGSSSLNMRVYEAMASGSLMLTDDKSDAHTLFEPGKEIVVYKTLADLRAKAVWLLENEDERKRIAEAGRKRVLREHTYAARMTEAAPLIEQFYRERLIFRKMEQAGADNPAHAFQLLSHDQIAGEIHLNSDHLCYRLAALARDMGEKSLAGEYIHLALEANPAHLEARELAGELL